MPRKARRPSGRQGFSLIEVLIGVCLVAVAVVGLAQLILLGMMNNAKSSEIANAVFLAQQQIDNLRTLTSDELATFPQTSRGESNDELLDLNADGATEFRRLTVVNFQDPAYEVQVLVFPASQAPVSRGVLLANPEAHKVRAQMQTEISR